MKKKREGIRQIKKRIVTVMLTLAMVFTSIGITPQTVKADDGIQTVSTLADLQNALADSSINTVVVTERISISSGITLDGQGKTVRVEKPGVDEAGKVVTDASDYEVFRLSGSNANTIKNMTIMGGSTQAVTNSSSGTTTLENVTITRSERGIGNSGKLVVKNSAIVRNVRSDSEAGAGIYNGEGAVCVLDSSSLSENRTTVNERGGGGLQNKGTMYINNSVIANNASTEIGGGIANYCTSTTKPAQIFVMNSTITGNVTSQGANDGGGIGNHKNDYAMNAEVYLVNSIVTDNYAKATGSITSSDIGTYSTGSYAGTQYFYNSIYGSLTNATLTEDVSNKTGNDNTTGIYNAYRSDGVATGTNAVFSTAFDHAVLMKNSSGVLYAGLKETGSPAVTGGAYATYFDYSDLSDIKMSYQSTAADSNTSIGGLTVATTQVTTDINGDTRTAGIIGACNTASSEYYTIYLKQADHGTATGGTLYGDTYAKNTAVTLSATADSSYQLKEWKNSATGTAVSTGNPYTFSVTENLNLEPVYAQSFSVSINLAGGEHFTWDSDSGATTQSVADGNTITDIIYTADDGYYFRTDYSGLSKNGITVTRVDYSTIKISGTPTAATTFNGEIAAAIQKTALATPTTTIDYVNEKITGFDTAAGYTIDGSAVTPSGGALAIDSTYFGQTLDVVRTPKTAAELGENKNSAAQQLGVGTKAVQPNVTGHNTSYAGLSDGSITSVNDTMEYKLASVSDWTPVTTGATSITGLIAGNYEVRVKAVADTSFASETASVVIAAGPQQTRVLNITAPTFTSVTAGYTQPQAKALTIANSGNSDATIASVALTAGDTTAFAISGSGSTVTSGGSIDTWFVQPAAGLATGSGTPKTYSVTITVTYDGGATAQKNVTLQVKPKTYAVTFDANGGSGTMQQQTATDGAAFTLPANGFSAPSGKQFVEWAIGNVSGNRVAAGGTYTFTGNATVYAIWQDTPKDTPTDTPTDDSEQLTPGWHKLANGKYVYYYEDLTQAKDAWIDGDDGKIRYVATDGYMAVNEFESDGTYTYFMQNDGSPMTDRLTYHPDGEHIIYLDESGHEVFSNFQNVKRSIAGEEVDDICFFNVYGYMYINTRTYDEAGTNLYYVNPCGVVECNGWFTFSDGNIGYARYDGTLMTDQFSYDHFDRTVYFQSDGTLARGLITDGTNYYNMDETDGHLLGMF